MDARSQIRQALGQIPVSWLHMPHLAKASSDEPAEKFLPALPPAIYAVVGGTVVGGGLAAGGVMLTRPKGEELDVKSVVCNLTLQEIEDRAVTLYEASSEGKGVNLFQQMTRDLIPGAKNPLVGYFLAGVAGGAGAVAIGARAGQGKP